MPAYTKMNVAQLRQICFENNIECHGLTKSQLIATLRDFDENAATYTLAEGVETDGLEDQGDDGDDDDEQGGNVDEDGGGSGRASPSHFVSVDDEVSLGSAARGPRQLQYELEMARLRDREAERKDREAQRKDREAQRRAEHDRIEREWEIEQQRIALLQGGAQANANHNGNNYDMSGIRSLLPKMVEGDAQTFFQSYEKVLQLNSIDPSMWAKLLPAQLSPKALKIYSQISLEDSREYEVVKKVILAGFKQDAQTHLKSFRSIRRTGAENYKMTLNRMRDSLRAFCEAKRLNSFDSLFDAMLTEQFLCALSNDTHQFVLSKQPSNSAECSEFADLWFEMSRIGSNVFQSKVTSQGKPGYNTVSVQPVAPGLMTNQSNLPQTTIQRPSFQGAPRGRGRGQAHAQLQRQYNPNVKACWSCGSDSHLSNSCLYNTFKAPYCNMCGKYHAANVNCAYNSANADVYNAVECDKVAYDDRFIVPCYVNDQRVSALRDSGNNGIVLVDKTLVTAEEIVPDRYIFCRGAFDSGLVTHKLPVAIMRIRSPRFGYDRDVLTEVGVCSMPLGIQCNIGNAFFMQHPEMTDILAVTTAAKGEPQLIETEQTVNYGRAMNPGQVAAGRVAMVVTRSGQRAAAASTQSKQDPKVNEIAQTRTRTDPVVKTIDESTDSDAVTPMTTTGEVDIDSDTAVTDVKAVNEPSHTDNVDDGRRDEVTQPLTDDGPRLDTNEVMGQTLQQFGNIDLSDHDIHHDSINGLNLVTNEFQKAQQTDPALQDHWTRAKAGTSNFRVINGLLYKLAPPHILTEHEYLLVVPQKFTQEIIELAHDSEYGAHLGVKKTYQRLASLFYFRKMREKVKRHVKQCRACQMIAPKQTRDKQPLQPIQIMHTHPFDDLTLDVMGGDLPVTAKGNRYLLVLVCNVSKWTHAVPIRNLKADTIADKLIEFFTLFGLPSTIRCDNMAGFRSQLFTKVCEKLGITTNFSTPFHFISHGSAEKANSTIESMLRKFLVENPKTWDKLIPFLLYALREVPNASTGFSPNQIVFGRHLKGLLQVVRETWTNGDAVQPKVNMTTAKYVQKLQESIQTALRVARENTEHAQKKMKNTYDRNATVRELEPGDWTLILLPTCGNKLFSKWQGPFEILRRRPNNNYDIQIGKRVAVMHINSLRKFHTADSTQTQTETERQPQIVNMIIDDNADSDDHGNSVNPTSLPAAADDDNTLNIGTQLTATQRREMEQLLADFSDVLTDRPGRTDIIEHVITVTDDTPCYQPSYRIPESMRPAVEAELNKMLKNGIIKYDPFSAWNSNLVIIKKANGKLRVCNNFINLNKKTVNVQYTMTNPSELLSRVAGARYITKIDLLCAFFQVPLSPESQKYTAFQTPFGTFSYKVMPMGLKFASATCQRLIDIVMRGAHRYAGSLLDDILVFSADFDTHLGHVKDVLERLRKAKLTANIEKCHFASNNIRILGHEVRDGLIYPNDDKVEIIRNWAPPKTQKQLKSFLGLVSYFRDHVERYADIAFPLTELLSNKKPGKLNWQKPHQEAFDKLRIALMSKPVLRPPNMSKPFIIMADSSTVAISGILMQKGDSDKSTNHVICYASRKLLPRERAYSICELELLAIVFSIQKFNHWVYGRPIVVYSDNRPIQWLASLSKKSPRLTRWSLVLQNYDITTYYIPSRQQLADCFTRMD